MDLYAEQEKSRVWDWEQAFYLWWYVLVYVYVGQEFYKSSVTKAANSICVVQADNSSQQWLRGWEFYVPLHRGWEWYLQLHKGWECYSICRDIEAENSICGGTKAGNAVSNGTEAENFNLKWF